MSKKVKGMVRLDGVTYRIVRIQAGRYNVVRIADDCEVGAFTTTPAFRISAKIVEPALLREVALAAIHEAKTSSVFLAAPVVAAPETEPPSSSAQPLSAH